MKYRWRELCCLVWYDFWDNGKKWRNESYGLTSDSLQFWDGIGKGFKILK